MIVAVYWNLNPEIVKLFDVFPLKYYGFLFVGGLLLGYIVARTIYIAEKASLEDLDRLALYVLIGAVVGARLGHCLFYEPTYYLKHPLEIILPFEIREGKPFRFTGFQGLASHGGAIGVLISILFYAWRTKTNIWWIFDRVALAAPLAGVLIRLGNFMSSEIIGKPTHSDYGVVFQRVDGLPRHPAQLYEAMAYLLIFVWLVIIYKKNSRRRSSGFIFGWFLVLLFSMRFVIEFFKEDQVDFEAGMFLNMGQLLSVPFIIAGLILIVMKRGVAYR